MSAPALTRAAAQRPPVGWDEPAGATPRGTLIVVPGRGEGAAQYERFGRRLAADSWKVRLVALDLAEQQHARDAVEKLLADESLPAPKVLVGADAGAAWVHHILDDVDADAAILAGSAVPASAVVNGWDAELDARSACPVHRAVLENDQQFERGALSQALPADWGSSAAPGKPVLVLHGAADPITSLADAADAYSQGPKAQVKVVRGGRHDVLNDAAHRAVAATIVLFAESLRAGPDLPEIITDLAVKGAAQ